MRSGSAPQGNSEIYSRSENTFRASASLLAEATIDDVIGIHHEKSALNIQSMVELADWGRSSEAASAVGHAPTQDFADGCPDIGGTATS
ncbi:hypothetical protein Y032_0261g553 [Ancylostoma ceylanicum]|uniref:Uncharacterized protein n=1 Tax=Ancylostoma ceylanicum TaxID=53326 RepID=A0A016SA55_9BILA|nr:hypothetical protein Y032_0261g553 [Ancylostoma ceylanicum]